MRMEWLRYLIMSRPRIDDTFSRMRRLHQETIYQPADGTFGY